MADGPRRGGSSPLGTFDNHNIDPIHLYYIGEQSVDTDLNMHVKTMDMNGFASKSAMKW